MLSPYIIKCYCKYCIDCSLFSAEDSGLHVGICRIIVSAGVSAGVDVTCVVLGTSIPLVC